jgi:uncharacterized membrane protein YidH (DUF202 family)
MAWVRTGTSLITFGFAVYKFFELKIASINPREGLVTTAMIGPREFGLVLIGYWTAVSVDGHLRARAGPHGFA